MSDLQSVIDKVMTRPTFNMSLYKRTNDIQLVNLLSDFKGRNSSKRGHTISQTEEWLQTAMKF